MTRVRPMNADGREAPRIKCPASERRRKFDVGFRRLLEHSTVHGLNHLSTASTRLGRSVWLILWMAGIVGFFINLSFIVTRYMTHPVLTSYKHDHETFIWPDITLCNPMAPYRVHLHNRSEKWDRLYQQAHTVAQNISTSLFETIDESEVKEVSIHALIHSTVSLVDFGVTDPQELVTLVALDKGQTGIYLTVEMDGTFHPVQTPVNRYFRISFLQKRYNIPCYTLQLAQVLNEEECKSTKQVSLGLKFGYDSNMIINSSYAPFNIDLFISLPGYFPEEEPMEILSGNVNKVTVALGRFKREPTRLPCRREQFVADIFDADLCTHRSVFGSADFCHKLVSQYLYLNECGCYSPFLPYPVINADHPSHNHPILCFNMSHFNTTGIDRNAQCLYDVYTQYRDDFIYMNLPEAILCEAFRETPPCESVSYVVEGLRRTPINELWEDNVNQARGGFVTSMFKNLFAQDLPEDRLTRLINGSQNTHAMLSYMRKNFGLVTITRKLPRGTLTHEELEYPLSELLSDLGGLMGLWIGISVIGLFEFVELSVFVGLTVITRLIERCLPRSRKSSYPSKVSKSFLSSSPCGALTATLNTTSIPISNKRRDSTRIASFLNGSRRYFTESSVRIPSNHLLSEASVAYYSRDFKTQHSSQAATPSRHPEKKSYFSANGMNEANTRHSGLEAANQQKHIHLSRNAELTWPKGVAERTKKFKRTHSSE